jgi:hypothetical protein
VVATPENFPGIDPTGATNSATGLQNFLNAIPSGGVGVIPPGVYTLSARLELSGKSLTVQAHGARFVSSVTGGGVRLSGAFETTYTVSSTNERLTTAGEWGNNGENMYVTDIVLSGSPGWKRGDLVKIVADNVPTDPDIASLRSGQSCTVVASSGTSVTLAGTLRDQFTTNVRIARYAKHRMVWEGGTFRHTDALLTGGTMAQFAFQARALVHPVFRDVTVEAAAGPAFDLRHTYGARVLDCVIGSAEDRSGFYGYGVNDCGEFSYVSRLHARRVRHAYTTGASGTTAGNSDLTSFGRVFGSVVDNGVAVGTSNGAWDCHGDADNVSFVNCVAVDCYGGFGLRGTNHRVIGGAVQGWCPGAAVSSATFSSAAYCYGSVVSGLVLDGIRGDAIYAMHDTTAAVENRPLLVDSITIKNRNTSKAIVRADRATVHVGTVNVPAGGSRIVTTNGGVVLNLERMVADGSSTGGGGTNPPPPPSEPGLTNSAEGQVSGTVATTANTGGTSGDAFSAGALAGSPTFTNAFAQSGSNAYEVAGTHGAQTTVGWTHTGATTVEASFWVRFAGLPTVNNAIFAQVRNSSSSAFALVLNMAGTVAVQQASFSVVNTSTPTITTGAWYRVDLTVTRGTTTSNGAITVAMYAASNLATPFYSYTSATANTGTTALTQMKFGKAHNDGTVTMHLDNLSAEFTA